jgi:hypothetical protein
MSYADEIRRQAEAAPRAALPAVTAALWRAFGEGKVTEAEAETLSVLIAARRETHVTSRRTDPGQIPNPSAISETHVGIGTAAVAAPRRAMGSRPRTDASMERRRRWAASGRLPPAVAARFTLAEQAVLALVAAETARRKDCRLSIENMAAVAGVCRSTVKNAIREAARLGLLTVEERQVTGWRNDTNVLRIVSREWLAWLRLTRRTLPPGGGVKSSTTTPTQVLVSGKAGTGTPPLRRIADPKPLSQSQSRAAGARSRPDAREGDAPATCS